MVRKPCYEVLPIGWVEWPLTDRAQAPRQGDEGAPPAWLAFEPEVAEAIRAIRPGMEVIVLTWLDRARRDVLVTRPRDDPAAPPAGGLQYPLPGPAQPHWLASRPGRRGRRVAGSRARPRRDRQNAAGRFETLPRRPRRAA